MVRAPLPWLVAALLLAGSVAQKGKADWVSWLRGDSTSAKKFEIDVVKQTAVLTNAAPPTPAPKPDKWASLRTLLDGWEFTSNYSVAIGDATGRLFVYEGGTFTMEKAIPTGSTSKWPSAMMFAGLVNDGTIASLDDPVSKYLSWWTKEPTDPRSTVTLRMLLSFTSGFGGGHPGEEANTRAGRQWRLANNVPKSRARWSLKDRLESEIGSEASDACDQNKGDITSCAQSIYQNVKLIGKPGQVYSYNSNHLQIAAAIAVATTGVDIHEVAARYLLHPYGMTKSYYAGKCPDFGGDLITTGSDYERFLSGLLNYKVLSKSIIDASEEDATPFMSEDYTLYGDYGFGHFLMCFDSVDGFTKKCAEEKCHMDPGAFGFIPIIDRKRGYYMEVVSAETSPTAYPLSGIPEYLAVALKPHVDAIMSATPPDPSAHLHYTPSLLSLGIADVNYCLDCVLHPDHCA